MDAAELIQSTLIGLGLVASGSATMSNDTGNMAGNGIPPSRGSDETPFSSITTLVSVFLSFSALRDWLKLFIIGGAVESCRRMGLKFWTTLVEAFWITACFEDTDSSYNWMLFWLSKHPAWKNARMIDVSTRSFGLTSPVISLPVNTEEDRDAGTTLCYLPSFSRKYTIWYKGHYLSITRTKSQCGDYGRTVESLRVDIFAMRHDFLNELLLEAKKAYREAEEDLISIYVADVNGGWRQLASRPKRPLNSIILDPGVKDLLLNDAKDFVQSKDWYAQRGIPFRRGYLLYGAPGSGKTSMIHSLAGELGYDVYIIPLARSGLDDTSLAELISDLPEKSIALMEDIDAAFTQGVTRHLDEDENPGKVGRGSSGAGEREPVSVSRVTLSGLLNALDGVAAQEGRILYATTNRYEALDPALCRPGRMDLHVEFKLASRYQAKELFKCFYLPPVADQEKPSDRPSHSRSQSLAKTEDNSIKNDVNTLNAQQNESEKTLSTSTSTSESISSTSSSTSPDVGTPHERTPSLSASEVLSLSDSFATAIPERAFSMASLQGYLMGYKVRPADAAEGTAAWVASELAKKDKKAKAKGKNLKDSDEANEKDDGSDKDTNQNINDKTD